jgi:RHH-type proline utilization regulon transcriptional repressor/proline dehydrogenase/delta 1-pyrroline-5-carboxylate dehydrogenase
MAADVKVELVRKLPAFANEPVLELRRAPVRAGLGEALDALDRRLPLSVPVIVGAHTRTAGANLASTDPGQPDRLIAEACVAGEEDVAEAVSAAGAAAPAWRAVGAAERAAALIGAAAWMRERRRELAALILRECAKPWPEADADVCEAIDFLEYYARRALELERPRPLLQVPGEHNEMRYVGRGVAAVISPWNFPVAIACGMTAAALAAGNPVILKPAEQSPGCGLMVVEALRAGGVPAEALSLLPGEGDVGAALVRHPGIHTIAFTGSMAVGLEIVQAAALPHPGQHHVKRVVAEFGGKNCVIVGSDADLDEAVPEIIASAFGYAGQKCSAAARVLAHEAVADQLIERLAGAAEVLVVGRAEELTTQVPPLIEESAQARLRSCGEQAESSGSVVSGRRPVPEPGWFAAPTVVSNLPRDSPLLHDEIFGPLLTVERVASVEEACDIIDELPYALTGGLFARDPATVRYVRERTPVGNLYVNRGITGAIVARQPFGGNRLSGTGFKAGGPDYLLGFAEPRVVSENTMRHGLAI